MSRALLSFNQQAGIFALLSGAVYLQRYHNLNWGPALRQRPAIVQTIVNFQTFTNAESLQYLGFDTVECQRLYMALGWPLTISIHSGGNDDSKDYDFDGIKAFLYLLFRTKNNHNLTCDERFWGFSYSTGSRVFNSAELWLATNSAVIDSYALIFFLPRFKKYSDSLIQRLTDRQEIIPPEAQFCCGFLDRTSIRVGRPQVL